VGVSSVLVVAGAAEILHGVFDKNMRAGNTFSKKMKDT
jgi:hypothetical protein